MSRSPHIGPLLLGLALFVGCAALPWPQGGRPGGPPEADGLLDLRGVVHVHTRGSHDSPGHIDDLIGAARGAGVHWVALAEHTRPGAPAARGRIDGVILIPGYEMRGWGGSILGLGLDALPPREVRRDPARLVAAVHAAGGVAFAGHLERSSVDAAGFREAGLDGLEISNLHANAEAARLRLTAGALLLPGPFALRVLLRTPSENLRRWERLPARSIVGGVDAHAKARVLGPLGGTVDGYDRMFRLLTTHVRVREASRAEILDALREGRSYVAFEGHGRVDAFRFARVGDYFELAAPSRARLALVCDGETADHAVEARAFFHIPEGARRCRGEAWLGERLWIVTSYAEVGP